MNMAQFLQLSSTALRCRMCAAGVLQSQVIQKLPLIQRRYMASLSEEFEEAKSKMKSLKEDPGNEVKLRMYALFKQGSEGKVKTSRPGFTDFVGRAKWDAWNSLEDMNKDEAKKAYIDLVNSLLQQEDTAATQASRGDQKYKHLFVEKEGGLFKITLNRPTKKNAIIYDMYQEWIEAMSEAGDDKEVVVTAITGAGDYFCSGNDLSNFVNVKPADFERVAEQARGILQSFVAAFIDFPKPLVGVINGPVVGLAGTTLGLYDIVYATDKANFSFPFINLGQTPEGCSSYIFPRMMGPGLATEVLLFNRKLTAKEAQAAGLVTEVFPDDVFQKEVWQRLRSFATLPVTSLMYGKQLLRDTQKDILHRVNEAEVTRLRERWLSDDCRNAIAAFFTRKM